MEQRPFGSSGRNVAVIGQGTWDIPEHGARRDEAVETLRRGVQLGMTHIDTAEMYGAGRAEELVGEAIRGLDREHVFLASKVLPSNASFKGTIAACEKSLQRMGIEYLDLYLLHWESAYPIEETMGALEQLVADGKTRWIGVSNFDVEELRAAQAALSRERLVCNQVLYHMRERGIESRLLPYCKEQEIAIVAYTPFGRGKFPAAQLRTGGTLFDIARKHGTTPRQVILRFLTRDENVFAIPKASTLPHVTENAGGAGWRLTQEDIAAIDAAFPARVDGPLASL